MHKLKKQDEDCPDMEQVKVNFFPGNKSKGNYTVDDRLYIFYKLNYTL